MNKQTIFIIDDDPSARRGLTRLVRAAGLNTESFASANDFLNSGKVDGPGCLILDVRMPEMTGPDLQAELAKNEYSMPIIFVSAQADVPTTVRTMKKGAVNFLTKPIGGDDLLEAIHESLTKDTENRNRHIERNSIKKRIDNLTPREREVMIYVIAGMLNKQIAAELAISEETVKIHRSRVMKKLAVVSIADLVRLCEKAGIESGKSCNK